MSVTPEEKSALLERLADALDGMSRGKTFRTLPITAIPLLDQSTVGPAFADFVTHQEYDSLWSTMDIHQRISQIAVPAYHLGGWYDLFVGATVSDYVAMRQGAATEEARQGQKLIIGPWLHGPLDGSVGEVDFGARASDAFVITPEIRWRWFDHWLKGMDTGLLAEPPVRLFVMGRNRWRDEQEWPLARTRYTPCYLHSHGHANTAAGDGHLSWAKPGAEAQDHYTYDPRDPVPTRGGGLCCSQAALAAGAFDQREIEQRADVLVYTSDMLEQDLEVTGPVKMVLWAASDAVDTDFTAKLVDVSPCGFARNVCDGIVRARYREGVTARKWLTPGRIERYDIELGPTSNVFLAGHRLRLEISSSNFPHYDCNSNTGAPVDSEDEMLPAIQMVHHDEHHASHILLPVIP
jgi:uncharacterized protein